MKRIQMLVPLVFLLVLASTTTPVLAKEQTKIKYTLTGMINDVDKGISGTMLLTMSGNLRLGTPDYEYTDSGVDSGSQSFWGDFEYTWWEADKQWMAKGSYSNVETWTESYSIYEARWYSPQPTWTGELIAIWGPTSATTFKVNLNPFIIIKMVQDGTREGETIYSETASIYWLNETSGEWVWDRDETYSGSWAWSYTYSDLMFGVYFSGKIQSKGRAPLEGMLIFLHVKGMQDGSEYQTISGIGIFGPYSLSIFT